MEHAIRIVTISREFGAGGSELAHAVGARLDWPVLDHDIVPRVAARLGMREAVVQQLNEHPPPLMHRLAAALLVLPPEAPVSVDPRDVLDLDAVADAACAELLEAARSAPVVLVGHGGQALFGDRADALHLRVVAPMEARLRRLCRRFGCDDRFAQAELRRTDEARRQYLRRYRGIDGSDPLHYHLEINTGRVTIDEAASLVVQLVEGRGAERHALGAAPSPSTATPSPRCM
jgi:cytidylate kinase